MKQRNEVVTYLLQNFAIAALADSPLQDQITKQADKYRGNLLGSLTPEERVPVLKMKAAIVELATKLTNCEDVTQIEATYNYLKALNAGEVLIAQDDIGEVAGYEANI
ncbi:hypothetical protein [Fibrella aquatilis]|uniref:Uncharacterized protein n=1 Tax=Fibrella aquatilis TaxID=2817059 RepID=A0A939G7L2_9BACT|nr:hypothetical protein [Fibrella aquatilis]MBO0933897.1 hypothetical protein [Fibrella aquatilis]